MLRWDLSMAEHTAVRELHLDGWRFTTSDLLVKGGSGGAVLHPDLADDAGLALRPAPRVEQLERIAFASP